MSSEAWVRELEHPTEDFFRAYAARVAGPEGLRETLREAIRLLLPILDWEGSLPQPPRSLLGVRAALTLRPHLQEPRFHRLMAMQLHGLAREPRSPEVRALQCISKGSGHWPQVELAFEKRLPSLAWGEVQGLETPEAAHFQRVAEASHRDMAGLGLKSVWADQLGDLFLRLDAPKATGRRLLGLAAWLGATEPRDAYWAQRARKRLGEDGARFTPSLPPLGPGELAERVRLVCDSGFVALLDSLCGWIKEGLAAEDLLSILVGAAVERLRDARRDLEGKTGWSLIYLATLSRRLEGFPEPWAQAAALVNFFPAEEAEDRLQPTLSGPASAEGLREAILDGEPGVALGQALALPPSQVLPILAEAVVLNDPAFNQGLQALTLAAAVDLMPRLREPLQTAMLAGLAKSLANSQGSGDLGDRAEAAFR